MRGNIRPHGDGWRIQVDAGADPLTGKRRLVSKVIRGSRRDAETALAALVTAATGGHHGGTGEKTFGQVLDEFVTYKSLSVEATTAATWRRQLAYIPPRLAAMPVGKVDVGDLEALYAQLLTAGHKRTGGPLSASSVRNVHVVIRGALELARRRRWITVNPAVDAERPEARRRAPTPAAPDALDALVRAAAAQHEALPVYLRVTVVTGARRSEVHGLRWSAVDFDAGRLTLRDVVVQAAGKWIVKPRTKTGGYRLVDLDTGTLDTLRALHGVAFDRALSCGVALPTDAFVFSDHPAGAEPWNPNTTARRFSRACAEAGLPARTRLHDLRHLMATHLIDGGFPIPVVSARLGHAQNSTTLDIYTARVRASDRAAADFMGHIFDPMADPPG